MIGKRTREALYFHSSAVGIEEPGSNPRERLEQLRHVLTICSSGYNLLPHAEDGSVVLDDDWVVKFHNDGNRVSLLHYPNFMITPHPTLSLSICVDLAHSSVCMDLSHCSVPCGVRVRDYESFPSRPLLHRKEEMLAHDHPCREIFAAVTAVEEALGLYAKLTLPLIGTVDGWAQVIQSLFVSDRKKLRNVWNRSVDKALLRLACPSLERCVSRGHTAIRRFKFSVPLRLAIDKGIVTEETSVLDYGCGFGDCVRMLRANGFKAVGYDPVHSDREARESVDFAHTLTPTPQDVVMLTYVLCTIETVKERVAVLRSAMRLAKKALVVSVRTDVSAFKAAKREGDGFRSKRGTFQHPYRAQEFLDFVRGVFASTNQCYQLTGGVVVVEA